MADSDPVKYDGKTVGEIRTQGGSKTFVWFQNPLRMYGDEGGFSISESVLGEVPTDVETFIVNPPEEREAYLFKRRDFETGEKLPIYDDRFHQTPPEPQYAVPKERARKTLTLE